VDYDRLNMLVKLGREYGHRKIRETGFSDTEHYICTFLYFHKDVSQDTVASSLMLDKTTVAKALLSLENKGLIVRGQNPLNRRKNVLQIAGAGIEIIKDSVDTYDAWLRAVNSGLSEQEQQQFDLLFDRLLKKALEIKEDFDQQRSIAP
jgi:DNA-binding MarR family transcriptional regulator